MPSSDSPTNNNACSRHRKDKEYAREGTRNKERSCKVRSRQTNNNKEYNMKYEGVDENYNNNRRSEKTRQKNEKYNMLIGEEDREEENYSNSASKYFHPRGYSFKPKRVRELKGEVGVSKRSNSKNTPKPRRKITLADNDVIEQPGIRISLQASTSMSDGTPKQAPYRDPRRGADEAYHSVRMKKPVMGRLPSSRLRMFSNSREAIGDFEVPGKFGLTVQRRRELYPEIYGEKSSPNTKTAAKRSGPNYKEASAAKGKASPQKISEPAYSGASEADTSTTQSSEPTYSREGGGEELTFTPKSSYTKYGRDEGAKQNVSTPKKSVTANKKATERRENVPTPKSKESQFRKASDIRDKIWTTTRKASDVRRNLVRSTQQ